jgi:hypothetical protein
MSQHPDRDILRAVCLAIATVLLLQGCEGCTPQRVKTLELRPMPGMATGMTGFAGSVGACLSAGSVPPPARREGPGQVQVGFDNFFREGSGPFPCHDVRAVIFRGRVPFDLSQFDAIVAAQLKFDAQGSFRRDGGGAFISQLPPASYATTLGMATTPPNSVLPFDTDATLPALPSIDVAVTSQVRDWVENGRTNFGFIIAGPVLTFDPNDPPKNNDARLSLYGNFRLVVTYVPEKNPRAPQ